MSLFFPQIKEKIQKAEWHICRTERTLILADTNTHTDGECFQFVDNLCEDFVLGSLLTVPFCTLTCTFQFQQWFFLSSFIYLCFSIGFLETLHLVMGSCSSTELVPINKRD